MWDSTVIYVTQAVSCGSREGGPRNGSARVRVPVPRPPGFVSLGLDFIPLCLSFLICMLASHSPHPGGQRENK